MLRFFSFLTTLVFVWSTHIGVAAAANVAILMPGSGGIVPNDFLVRNDARFKAAGIRTILTTSSSTAASTIAAETAQGHKVVLVGMSLGTVGVASALASGARPAGVVFVSGLYPTVMETLGSPNRLPPTLLVHHSHDVCPRTLPSSATEFAHWSRGKARVHWVNTTGEPSPNPCNARAAHAFFRKDGPAVSAIIGFIRSH
jgi:predicted esterase